MFENDADWIRCDKPVSHNNVGFIDRANVYEILLEKTWPESGLQDWVF